MQTRICAVLKSMPNNNNFFLLDTAVDEAVAVWDAAAAVVEGPEAAVTSGPETNLSHDDMLSVASPVFTVTLQFIRYLPRR
jgi:hypothetical protein